MNLLIVTQTVDRNDPVLGFFHRWIEEFSKYYDHITVICLKEGEHTLPTNVQVFSLGKERGRVPTWHYVIRFLQLILKYHITYNRVFVHMNEEYVLLGGLFWHIYKKPIILWRNHKKGSFMTQFSGFLSTYVCYTSPMAYVAHFKNSMQMPLGIDTDFFTSQSFVRKENSILFAGRLDKVKHLNIFLAALEQLYMEKVIYIADIYGDATYGNELYAQALKKHFSGLPTVSFHTGVPYERMPELYGTHAIYVNLTPSGSFDKTIGESMASGCIVVAVNEALTEILPDDLMPKENTSTCVAKAIQHALCIPKRQDLIQKNQEWVKEHHSLTLLCHKIFDLFRNA